MLRFPGGLKVFVALELVDLRKSFNGFEGLVRTSRGRSAAGRALRLYQSATQPITILYLDGTGFWLLMKRLKQGTLSWPKVVDSQVVKLKLAPEALAMLTDGIDLRGAKMRSWHEREN